MRNQGWIVALATSAPLEMPELKKDFDELIEVGWSRSITDILKNLGSWWQMRSILKKGAYDVVHTHTPVASFVTRFASIGLNPKTRPKIVYTAHGFHFHRNGLWLTNWCYRFLEKVIGRWTDVLVVINNEDYNEAKRIRVVGNALILHMPGIGIEPDKYDRNQFTRVEVEKRRAALGIPSEAFVILMVAEFNLGKKHSDVLNALACCSVSRAHVIFAGAGVLMPAIQKMAKDLNLLERCHFLGLVQDVPLLCAAAQVMVLPSEREGLPRAVMEAMAAGLPVVGADSRGIRELLEADCGILHKVGDFRGLATAFERIACAPELGQKIAINAGLKIRRYSIGPIIQSHQKLYESLCAGSTLRADAIVSMPAHSTESFARLPRRLVMVGGLIRSLTDFRGLMLQDIRRASYEVLAVASDLSDDDEARLKSWGVRYSQASLSRAAIALWSDAMYYWKLERVIDAEDCDVIIAYTHKPIVYGALAKARRKSKKACKYFAIITGLGYAFTDVNRLSLHKWVTRRALCWMYRCIAGHIEGFVFQNENDRALFEELGILKEKSKRLVVRGSGVDLNYYRIQPLPEGACKVLLIARLLSEKGIREWAQAARRVRRKHPLVQFNLVGPFDTNPSAISADEVSGWQNEGIIRYCGMRDDVRQMLSDQCTVYVLPSYREGTPRTVLEAMATGRAIITTDAPGCRDTVFDAGPVGPDGVRIGSNGMLVPVKSVDALVAAIERFVEAPDLAGVMGLRSRSLAEEHYDARKVNKQMLEFMGLVHGP
jgi:glycosyltransferase involved in cell wall biosynthesis